MKICFIVPCDLSKESGGRTHTLEFAKNWSKFGHEVFLFSRGLEENNRDFRYVNIPFILIRYKITELTFSVSSIVKLIIYHFLFKFDIIYHRTSAFDWSILFGRLLHIPVITELNDVPFSETYKEKKSKERRISRKILLRCTGWILRFNENLVFKSSIKFIATTQKIKDIEKYEDIKDKIYFIPFGANTELFKPLDKLNCREALSISKDNKIICFVGSFLPWQGLEYIIKAMPMIIKKIPNVLLLIVGDQNPRWQESREVKSKLIKMVEEFGLNENIIFAGRVSYENVPTYINASDVCVVAQRPMRAGFSPFKLFEYMACGKPVVASNIEGVREIIKESGGGVLVPPENPENLAEAIIRLLKDEDSMKKMGENGLKCVAEKYSWENVASEAMKVCEDAIREKKGV